MNRRPDARTAGHRGSPRVARFLTSGLTVTLTITLTLTPTPTLTLTLTLTLNLTLTLTLTLTQLTLLLYSLVSSPRPVDGYIYIATDGTLFPCYFPVGI